VTFNVTVTAGWSLTQLRDAINTAAIAAGANTRAEVVQISATEQRLKIINIRSYTGDTLDALKSQQDYRGIATKLVNSLATFTNPSTGTPQGVLSLEEDRIEDEIDDIDERIEEIKERLEREKEFLFEQWAYAERLVTQYKATLQFLLVSQAFLTTLATAGVGTSV
jgi:flagellar motility protein MotE (MotC chaperone)